MKAMKGIWKLLTAAGLALGLEPKADAQLHLIIADIGEGIEAMEGKAKKVKRQAGAIKVVGALEKYGSFFDHPGWQPIKH